MLELLNPINQSRDQFMGLDELLKELSFELVWSVHREAVQDGLDVRIGLLYLLERRHELGRAHHVTIRSGLA